MTATNDIFSIPASAQPGDTLKASLDRVREAYERHAEYVRVIRQLSSLSDRDLADIGIKRGDIRDVAMASAARTI